MTSAVMALARWRAALGRIEQFRWAVLIPMTVAAVLGLIRLGDKSMWLDEAFSASIIKLPTSELLLFLWRNEQQASPYYLSLQGWSVLGFSETTLRLLSVVFGVLGVAAVYFVARRFGVALPASLLLAVSPFFIHFEQEARVYTLLVAWSAICTLAYLRLIDRPDRLRAAVYVITGSVLIYVHPLSVWLLVAHALVTLVSVAPPMRWRLLALYVPVLVAAIPMARFLWINHERASWIPPTTLGGVVRDLTALSGGAALALALAVVIALGLWRTRASAWPALRLPILWVVCLLGGVLAMSLFIQPLWVDRYLIGVLPPLFIVTAWVIQRMRWRWAVAGALVALSLVAVNNWYVNATKDDWRAAAAYVEAEVQPGDGVIIWPNYYRLPFAYYSAAGEPLYPSTPWSTLYLPFRGMQIDLPADATNERVWLVRNVSFVPSPEVAAFLADYDTISTRLFGQTQPQVDLLVRRP